MLAVWLKWWSHANTVHNNNQADARYLGGYTGLQVAAMLSAGTLTWLVLCELQTVLSNY